MLNLTHPRYVMPMHGDHKRLQLHAELAQAVGVPDENIFTLENGLPLEIDAKGARLGKPRAGRHDLRRRRRDRRRRRRRAARPPHAVRRRHLHRRRHRLRPGRLLRRPARGPRPRRPVPRRRRRAFLDEFREAVEDALDRAAEQKITEIEPLQQLLHDDLATFVYDRLKRRPMVLPVVVEV